MGKVHLDELSNRYAFCDPSGGKRAVKRTKARSAIVVVAQDTLSRFFVLHAWGDAVSTDTLIDTILDVQEKYQPRVSGIEANAMQSLFADALLREARFKGKKVPIRGIHQTTKVNKEFRIRSILQSVIADGRLFTQQHQIDLYNEISSFPTGATCDIVDALASAIALAPPPRTRRQRDGEVDNLASYLRQSGAHPREIEKRIRALERSRV